MKRLNAYLYIIVLMPILISLCLPITLGTPFLLSPYCLSPVSSFDSVEVADDTQLKISPVLEKKIDYWAELLLANTSDQRKFEKRLHDLFVKNKSKESALIFQQLILRFPQLKQSMFGYLHKILDFDLNPDIQRSLQVISPELIKSFKMIYALNPDNKTRKTIIGVFKEIGAFLEITVSSPGNSFNKMKAPLINSLLETTIDIVKILKKDSLSDSLIKELIVPILVDSPLFLDRVLNRLQSDFLKESKILTDSLVVLYYPEIKEICFYGLFGDYFFDKGSIIKAGIGRSMLSVFKQLPDATDRDKVMNFIMRDYIVIKQAVDFFKEYRIECSNIFWEDFFRKRESTLLFMITQFQSTMLQNNNEQKVMIDVIKELFAVEREENKRILTIDEALRTIINVFMLADSTHDDLRILSRDLMKEILDYKRNAIGDKKFLTSLKDVFSKLTTNLLIEVIVKNMKEYALTYQNERAVIEKKVKSVLKKNETLTAPLINLLGLYLRMKNRFPSTAAKVEEVLVNFFVNEIDVEELNEWLYTEAKWNKAIYSELVEKYNYSPKLWEEGVTKTFFADEDVLKKAQRLIIRIKKLQDKAALKERQRRQLKQLLKELDLLYKSAKKVRIEVVFDFFEDSYGGVGMRDCFRPGDDYESIPVVHALETNAVLLRVYSVDNNKLISRIQLVMTPKGLVVLTFPSDALQHIRMSRQVFEVVSDLLQKNWVPAVYMNVKNSMTVGSAGYNYASQHGFLKKQVSELEKIEPWNTKPITLRKFDKENPRHYDMYGKNRDVTLPDGRIQQVGVFKTTHILESKERLSRYESVSIESLLTGINFSLFDDAEKDFFIKLKESLDTHLKEIEKEDKKQAGQYKKKMYPYLKVLKDYFSDTKIEPKDLISRQAKLQEILSEEFFKIMMGTLHELYPESSDIAKKRIIKSTVSLNNLFDQIYEAVSELKQSAAKKNWFAQKIKRHQLNRKMALLKKYYFPVYDILHPVVEAFTSQDAGNAFLESQFKVLIMRIMSNYLPQHNKVDITDKLKASVLLALSA